MPPFKSKKVGPRTHSESRQCLCAVCFTKASDLRSISTDYENLIQKYVNRDFSMAKTNCPTSVCSKCRLKLGALKMVISYSFWFSYLTH